MTKSVIALLTLIASPLLNPVWAADVRKPQKKLPVPGEVFTVEGRTALVILPPPENLHTNRPTPWVWYAPTLPKLPAVEETWMFERFLAAGIRWPDRTKSVCFICVARLARQSATTPK